MRREMSVIPGLPGASSPLKKANSLDGRELLQIENRKSQIANLWCRGILTPSQPTARAA
jgi:hypothetical protein